jgi:hypothetical protein
MQGLIAMEDIAEEKAHKYGSSFLSCIKDFCSENDWPTDTFAEQISVSEVCVDDVSNVFRVES